MDAVLEAVSTEGSAEEFDRDFGRGKYHLPWWGDDHWMHPYQTGCCLMYVKLASKHIERLSGSRERCKPRHLRLQWS